MHAKLIGRLVLTALVVSTIGCDRVTKQVATTMLAGRPERSYLAGLVQIGYVENPGGFLSLGAALPAPIRTALFTVVTGTALLALTIFALRGRWNRVAIFGVALFVAGGASNWFDRIVRGSVVDFLNVGIGPLRTGVFNVADVAIMLGALIFMVAEFRVTRPHAGRRD